MTATSALAQAIATGDTRYGYFVGCNKLGQFPYPLSPSHYPGAVWYSLPGLGRCIGPPTGTEHCTFSFTNEGYPSPRIGGRQRAEVLGGRRKRDSKPLESP